MVEMLENGGINIIDWLLRIFNKCMESGVVPEDWKEACIIPIYKGIVHRNNCIEYTGKICGRVLINIVIESVKEQVAEEQGGFRSSRGCIDKLFVLKQLVEKYRAKRKELHVAFMDLEKTLNKVCREELRRKLHACGVDGYLIRSISSLYNGSRACVRLGSRVRKMFDVRMGLRQGCVMSPWLFNISLTKW